MKPLHTLLMQALGHQLSDAEVAELLVCLDVPWRPEVNADKRNDWILCGNVELGFEAYSWFHADDAVPASVPPVLQQVCFYAPRPGHVGPRIDPPMELRFEFGRAEVRRHLTGRMACSRWGRRDVFESGDITFSVTYDRDDGAIDSVLVLIGRAGRPSLADPPLDLPELCAYVGRPWQDPGLRARFDALTGSEPETGRIKRYKTVDLVKQTGVRLLFDRDVSTWLLSGFAIYRSRVRDAATWTGDLPMGLSFQDNLESISRKLGISASLVEVNDLDASASWFLGDERLSVVFDLTVNLMDTITLAQASYWDWKPAGGASIQ